MATSLKSIIVYYQVGIKYVKTNISVPCPEGFNHYFARRNSCYYIPLETEDVGGVNWTEAKVSIT